MSETVVCMCVCVCCVGASAVCEKWLISTHTNSKVCHSFIHFHRLSVSIDTTMATNTHQKMFSRTVTLIHWCFVCIVEKLKSARRVTYQTFVLERARDYGRRITHEFRMHITYSMFIASAVPRAKYTGPNLSEHRKIIIIGSVCLCRAVVYTMSNAFELKMNSEKKRRTKKKKNGT